MNSDLVSISRATASVSASLGARKALISPAFFALTATLPFQMVVGDRYRDELKKKNDEWFITLREQLFDFMGHNRPINRTKTKERAALNIQFAFIKI